MEEAIFPSHNIDCGRRTGILYIGSEFCQRRLPAKADMESLLSEYNGKIVLVTPHITDAGAGRVEELLEILAGSQREYEVVINDWGILNMLIVKNVKARRILGRIQVSRYLNKFHYEIPGAGSVNGGFTDFPPEFIQFAKFHGISAFEFNIPGHMLHTAETLRAEGISSHIYYPFAYLNMSRFCKWPSEYKAFMKSPDDGCSSECFSKIAVVHNAYMKEEMYAYENAYLMRMQEDAGYISEISDRIVINEIPGL